ncbi:MAG: short chain dehydrogenase family protein [Paenibacillus sp.]|nr:short chain dehydrogenase family protein [Paenibacillus sp.]
MGKLTGQVAVVAGATRGAGRAIAMMLGAEGATVYVTGRSVRGKPATLGRSETIEETAELVTQLGGVGIAVRVDHTIETDIKSLFDRVRDEQGGQLDVLVNDVWGGDELTNWELPFWEHSLSNGLLMQQRAVHSHMMTSYYGVPLMIKRGRGLVIEITDGVDYKYRGNLYYSLAKISNIHLAEAMAADLAKHNVTALAVTPGFLRSEAMLDLFGVTESNWKEGAAKDPHFIASETPFYVGKGIACLAADPNVTEKSGQTWSSWALSDEYGFTDQDGTRPHWGNYYKKFVLKED